MEKKFTLMKTLTAVCSLVFPRNKKNSRAVTNKQTSTGGCGNGTTVNNHLIYVNDPDNAGAFLFFNQASESRESGPDSYRDGSLEPRNNEEKVKSKEDPDSYRAKKVNDELAQRNMPKPVNNNWRPGVNDDM